MPVTEANHVCAVGAELGEGPVWVERDASLWFVDIKGRRAHRFCPDTLAHRCWSAPETPGFLAPLRGRGFVIGLKSGLHHFDPGSSRFVRFAQVEPDRPDNRLNDGCVSPEGALWFGSMHDPEGEPTGVLYRLDAGGRCVALDAGYVITNGPAFSPDGRTFYHTDTARRLIYAFDRLEPHRLSRKRVLLRIEPGAGAPDGTTVDAEGCLWVALWGGWGVRRYAPSGELIATVALPCANITKIAFGGADLRTAYVTTAWLGLTEEERARQPLAGDLFSFASPAPGLSAPEVTIDGGNVL
jgi:sugar lactone lactonase YvrE